MKHVFALTSVALLLVSCTPAQQPMDHGGHGTTHGTETLAVEDRSTEKEIAFIVLDGPAPFSDYGVSHTKEMHLIVVRDDLRHFQHLHPERDAQGVWRVPFTAGAGGDYWIYADFVESGNAPHTIRFAHAFAGQKGAYGVEKDTATEKTMDGYTVAFRPQVSGQDVTFTYDITDASGKKPHLEEYLGATGHSVLISETGGFIHTHPNDASDTPVFATSVPPDPFYRAFTQFQIGGEVRTVSFDWQP